MPGATLTRLAGLPQRLLLGLVRGYRLLLKPWLGNACRFEPTCSAYALQALTVHGAAAGSYLAARRILRCQPWCAGGCDPVPGQKRDLHSPFRRWPRPPAASTLPDLPDNTKTLP